MFRNVSSEQLSRIEDILRNLDLTNPGERQNRRRTNRIVVRTCLMALVISPHASPVVRVFSRNISTSGIGFVARRLFMPGEFLVLFFALPGREPKLVLSRVSFSRYVGGGLYETGASFIACARGSTESEIPAAWRHDLEKFNIPAPAVADSEDADEPGDDTAAAK